MSVSNESSPYLPLYALLFALLLDNKLFHREISVDNVMLSEDETYNLLVDFDLAVELQHIAASVILLETVTQGLSSSMWR